MALNENWHIKSRSHSCSVTDRRFEDGEEFYAAIFEAPTGEEGFVRRDYCKEAWDDLLATDGSEMPFSFWKTTYEAPVHQPKEETVKKEDAESLLRRLVEEDEAHTENARFILAVMLERKKILKNTDTQRIGDTKLLLYEHRKTGDVLMIVDPEIPLDQIESVQQEIADLLAGGPAAAAAAKAGIDTRQPEQTPDTSQANASGTPGSNEPPQ
ncbi:hypothetical protein [Sulfuriroseicoccus oceanibius]|uniref:Uncharacterized protein n=1 Tax=Sulfuriroseicoccus oceanibius TaxID=2707525 RepID=A0A6B3L8Q3_9BACT|nr:hypothetical protein [Sulfuriroseicoccus oceanibius]QQL43831.1 hypothetical protein G3M56_007960 [Sulfuriroseicoccus oceanibius]